ncbi:hypothetical protein [Haloterrigena turkmenica]|nr:hypothetical protein [Haloterrigena turkmenica]
MTNEEIETVIETLGLGDGEPDDLVDVDDQFEVLEAGRKAVATDGGCE